MNKRESNLKPFQPGDDPRRNTEGRPRKFVSTLTTQGYTREEVNGALRAMLSMTELELKEVVDNKAGTVLERTIAKALQNELKKGSLATIESLLSRTFGKPRESQDINFSNMTDDQLDAVINKLTAKANDL